MAWNEIRDNVIGAPLEVIGAEEVARRLNGAQQSVADLEPESYYAKGGWVKDGIIDIIEKEMAAKFPSHDLPDFNDYAYPTGILAYSYLAASVPFKYPFRQLDDGLTFTDSRGIEAQVSGFGLWEAWLSECRRMREQMEIVYLLPVDPNYPYEPKEYAIDLCRNSKPYQIVIAAIEPTASLAEAIAHIEHGAEQFRRRYYYDYAREFGETDELRVPEMFWRLDHRLEELIGKGLGNVGLPIVDAWQKIEFRLDRSGAMVESDALVFPAAVPRRFVLDKPFLIYMKKRDAEQPFFVMWVDNAELLARK